MERIDSSASTLSDMILPPVFAVGDRVRRANTGTAGTVRYAGPLLHGTAAATASAPAASAAERDNSASSNGSSAAAAAFRAGSSSTPSANTPETSQSSAALAAAPLQRDALSHTANSVDSLQDVTSPTVPMPSAAAAATTSGGEHYCGVEWDKPEGKNDGTVQGVVYFSCRKDYGSLLPPKNLNRGIPLCRALEARYGSSTVRDAAGATPAEVANRTATKPMQLGPAIGFRDDSGAFVKVVSSDCTANDTLRLVSTAGDGLGRLFPNLRDLSLAGTLFADWHEVALIGRELPLLQSLDLSRNVPLGAPSSSIAAGDELLQSGFVISSSVKELRVSDLGGVMTPDCFELILGWFPALASLFAARNNLSLLDKAAPVPRVHQAQQQHKRDDSGSVMSVSSSSSCGATASLTYLNIEGNLGIESLDDVARLLGSEQRCRSLQVLNVSSTSISDALQLPDVHPGSVYQQRQSGTANGSPAAVDSNSNDSGEASPLARSPQKGAAAPAAAAASLGASSSASSASATVRSSNNGNGNNSLMRAQIDEPPLFPALHSLYMNKLPVASWAALSRLLHRAAYCDQNLQDVHFTTCAQDRKEGNGDDDGEGGGGDDDAGNGNDDGNESTVSSMAIDKASCFLPDDFRDRRRLTVAFMPPCVKKLNRSEITTVERASAVQRSVLHFLNLVRKSDREVAEEDMEEAEQQQQQQDKQKRTSANAPPATTSSSDDIFKDISACRFGQLPYHLQKAIAAEVAKQKPTGAAGGPGFIYRPASIGPRMMHNEFDVAMRAVFIATKEHQANLEREGFMSILDSEGSGSGSGAGSRMVSGAASLAASGASLVDGADDGKATKRRSGGGGSGAEVMPMRIDVRWETRELEDAVRAKLGLQASSASGKSVKVALVHVDRELMSNPGAVARRMHLKPLHRPWEKLHMSRIAPGDDLLVLIGP